ncbi:MAG: phage holin family protein [Coriobacteriaceae bacterium]|jgi:putative membrane protein|nr:phage holin family protein [Coriobacteriaceae bacterium]
MKVFLRWVAAVVAVVVAIVVVPGIQILGGLENWGAIAGFALILALVNMIIKPILKLVSFPITVLTLGLFLLVLNACLLYLSAWIANTFFGMGFTIDNFGSALLAGIIISIVVSVVNTLTGANKSGNKRK